MPHGLSEERNPARQPPFPLGFATLDPAVRKFLIRINFFLLGL
jgi:hypothetical protein